MPVTSLLLNGLKNRRSCQGLVASAPEVVFGDFYLAWSQEGLYLATISMDYYDPILLAFDGDTVPIGEVFRIDWGIDAGAGPYRLCSVLSRRKSMSQAARLRRAPCSVEATRPTVHQSPRR